MENLVVYEGGKALTTSRRVAQKFNKRHADLLRTIQEMELPEDYRQRNFTPIFYTDTYGRQQSEFVISRDGFTFLAMGFSGKKATKFKIEFIEAFNKMEQALKTDSWMSEALVQNLKKSNQLKNTKEVATLIYSNGGVDAVKEYHKKSTKLHAGCSVSAIKNKHLLLENEARKGSGKKEIKSTPSAKEILRLRCPEIAAAMSMTDSFCKIGHKLEEVASESVACIPIFKRMIESGLVGGQKNLCII